MKEPNGTLVMTTCKCRENTKNLVMTRTWFEEQLQNKVAWGVEQERKRVLEILEFWGVSPIIVQLISGEETNV
jgi:hypothetical protein